MLYRTVFALCWCLIWVRASEDSPRIIVVGAGPAGIAAASRLFENGFDNITVLEAENRIGGRVCTVKFGEYWVDLGGQWVHGEKGNVAFDMAWPLGIIERSSGPWNVSIFSSSGVPLAKDAASSLFDYYVNVAEGDIPDEYTNTSAGEYYTAKLDEYLEASADIRQDQREPLKQMLMLFDNGMESADSWFNVSAKGSRDYQQCEGDLAINWKDKGYSTILDMLMKKFPNPAEELPVLNNTVLGKEVSRINYNCSDGVVRVVATDGDEYSAEHVIVTTSLGVLKADHETLFDPRLPEEKINSIKGLEFGSVAKIYLEYTEPWWIEDGRGSEPFVKGIYWTEEDRNEFANDPERSWLLGMFEIIPVEHKPRIICCWFSGPRARQMEEIPEDRIYEQLKLFLRRVFGKTYNLTEPIAMLRSQWFTNKHFRGTYTYRSLETERSGAGARVLLEPISRAENPLVLFAGEATSPDHYATVHGAIDSGQREADRLIKLYKDRKSNSNQS